MSYQDFFRALTPYNYTELKDNKGYFDKNKIDILKVADVDSDGVISFPEFFFFITILQLPDSILAKEFIKFNNKMNKEQFSQTLTKLRKKTFLGGKQTNKSGIMPDARMISAKEKDFEKTNKEISDHLFTSKSEITFADFKELRNELKIALRHYEFYQYDVEEDETISVEDFAKSILICLPLNQANTYIKRIHSLDLKGRVSFKEFIAFSFFID